MKSKIISEPTNFPSTNSCDTFTCDLKSMKLFSNQVSIKNSPVDFTQHSGHLPEWINTQDLAVKYFPQSLQ